MNKDNNKYEANPNGVRYVNTTHDEFSTMMRDKKKGLPVFFNLSTQKVDEYLCDLGPAPDDVNKDWGCVYQFPHYLIHSPLYRIEPDMDDDMVDITPICAYNENTTVLINKKDMSCPGFKRFILDSCDSIIALLNSLKISVDKDPENVAAYCQMMTMIQFINRYNKYIHIFNSYNFKDVLVHSLDHNYRVYRIAIIPEDGSIRGDDTISYYDKNLNEKSTVKKTGNNYDYRIGNPKYKYEEGMNFTKMSDKIDYEIASHDTFTADLITYYDGNLRKLVKEFNEKADEVGIEKAWKTKVGFIILKYIDYIGEFKTENMKPIKLYVDEYKHLCFTDRVKKSEISVLGFETLLPTPKANADYKYNPDDFKVEDDDDYITEPGNMIIIYNNKNLEDGTIRGDDTISYYDKNLNEKIINKNVDVINDKDDASVYPTAKQPIAVDIDEDKLKEHVKRLSRAKFIRSMMKDENLKKDLCADWPKYLEGLINLFNDEVKDGCPIKNAWNTPIGKIIKEFTDFLYDNAVYICKLRQEEDVSFTIKVNKQCQLELLIGVYEEDDDETYYTEPEDKFGIYYRNPIDEDTEELTD